MSGLGLGLSRAKKLDAVIPPEEGCEEEECLEEQTWNSETCRCDCNEVGECREGEEWNVDTCRCERG